MISIPVISVNEAFSGLNKQQITRSKPMSLSDQNPNNIGYNSWEYKANKYANEMNYQSMNDKLNQHMLNDHKQHNSKIKNNSFLMNNFFKPECCPSVFSNSSGCICLTPEQLTYLRSRGRNNI